ncbi:P-loop containing nucleoside triphosphate hydrolase protein [Daedaleopsis nitida]|nr:P-loop containing nucleoside triphosphate hydrolase protein [Daedaleopsis nitida]
MLSSILRSDMRMLPLYGAGISAVSLTVHAAYYAGLKRCTLKERPGYAPQPRPPTAAGAARGLSIFLHRLARFLCCVLLLSVSLTTFSAQNGSISWARLAQSQVLLYAYTVALAAPHVLKLGRADNPVFSYHLTSVLCLTLAVYTYRNVLPLFFRDQRPADGSEGLLLWIKLFLLFVAAVGIPLSMPRPYSPSDPASELTGEPSKQQTASIFSFVVFGWLDDMVAKASRVSHIPLSDFPPLANANATKRLADRSFPFVDPFELGKDKHIFWAYLSVYYWDFGLYALLAIVSAFMYLSRIIATQGLLAYLEVGGHHSSIYPWTWAIVLFVGPTIITLTEEWYQWLMHVQSARIQAILTELLFQHALRIRVKADTSQETEEPEAAGGTAKPDDKQTHLAGRLSTLVTVDIENIKNGNKFWLQLLVKVPVLVGCSLVYVYKILGWSALVGLGAICVLVPLPGYLSSWIQRYQADMMKKTDARVQSINETLGVVRMIKLFGWEARVAEKIKEHREAELAYIRKTRFLELTNNLINFAIPLVTMAITFGSYTILQHGELTASRLFATFIAFSQIQMQFHVTFYAIPVCTQAKVSLDRINDLLHNTELLDEFERKKANPTSGGEPATEELPSPMANGSVLGMGHTTFTWADDGSRSPSAPSTPATSGSGRGRTFAFTVDGAIAFKRGRINLIVGPTGSGKTSLLMALLGEMHAIPSGPDAFVSLPRTDGVAYAAQESWIQNETIRDNILFGAPYDEVRYNKVIKQCALERDLSLFDAGDKTEVGEKGITLSGGQKARITLARAVYSSAEILLLDDVLAALDVHTGRWIVDKCFKGDLVRGRTIVLVSHNVALVKPVADFVVALGADGRIVSQGSLDKALQEDHALMEELATEEQELGKKEDIVDDAELDSAEGRTAGKLVVAEEIGEGHVRWDALQLYLNNTSSVPWIYWSIYIGTLCLTHILINSQTYALGYWAAQYEHHVPSEVSVSYYLSLFFLLIVLVFVAYSGTWSTYIYGSDRASRVIHRDLVASVLGSTLRWFDMTPTSRIVARCTADVQAVDTAIPRTLLSLIEATVFMLIRVLTTTVMAPFFIIPAVAAAALGGWLSSVYMRAQLCVKRELSNARAPVIGHFGSAISGLVSIRAYGAQERFRKESYARMDKYNRAMLTYDALNRWITIRSDVLGTALSALLALYLVNDASLSASNAGFTLSMALGFSMNILFWMRTLNELQVTANILERIKQYLQIEQEPKTTVEGVPPAYWPASGGLRVEKLSARYSADGSEVLHDLSFEVKSGERIGIVGRTGSGKSSLTLALLRCILTSGRVYYDGIATDSINLDALRSSITIIPQIPELLSGSLRENLDPFGEHDDATLNDVLHAAGLFSLQEETDHARITLDTPIAGGGSNLSVGQRQIIALARAMVRRSKLLILDEATSAIDYDTDTIIQKSLREELGQDVTVLTIAHRLQSIMDADKILVLDAGHIVEFDKPSELLQREGGYFRGLVDGSGDRAALYAMAGRTHL